MSSWHSCWCCILAGLGLLNVCRQGLYTSAVTATVLRAGVLFQYPGLLISALVGAGAANFLKHPAPWLHGAVSGESARDVSSCPCALAALPALILHISTSGL